MEAATPHGPRSNKGEREDRPSPSSPVVPNHAYTVVSYNSDGTVTVRNPWGHNYGTAIGGYGTTADGVTNVGDGELRMPLAEFQRRYSFITRQDTSPINPDFLAIAATGMNALHSLGEELHVTP